MCALVLSLPGLVMTPIEGEAADAGTAALPGLMSLAQASLSRLREHTPHRSETGRIATIGRVRGTGPGASFGALVEALEQQFPLRMQDGFEGRASIAGGAWPCPPELQESQARLVKLRFEPHTRDLPLHAHEHSDRFIFVLGGRGFFHVTPKPLERFDGGGVRSVPVRSRDAVMFSRGTLHTFSTASKELVLLSYHAPFIPFDSPQQFTVPACPWCPPSNDGVDGRVALDPAWTVLTVSEDG